MGKLIDCILNLLDPPSQIERRMERRWQIRLRKIQNKMLEENASKRK